MDFKKILSAVKSFFKALGLKILAFLKGIGPFFASLGKKIWSKIKSAPKKKLITYTLMSVILITVCLLFVLCSDSDDGVTGDDATGGTAGGVTDDIVNYGPKYELLSDGTYAVVGYVFPEGTNEVELVSEYEKCAVTKIGKLAFANLDIESIVIPESIKIIDEYAFSGCTSLKSVVIPKSVELIGTRAFNECKNITSVEFKCAEEAGAQLSIGDYAFAGCYASAASATYDLVISENVVSIGTGAFENCVQIKSVSLPATLEELSNMAFYKCTELVSVSFAANCALEEIKPAAFKACAKLSAIVLPEKLVKLGSEVFSDCEALAEITLPKTLKSIGSYAFRGCEALKKIVVPSSGFVAGLRLVDKYSSPLVYGGSESVSIKV